VVERGELGPDQPEFVAREEVARRKKCARDPVRAPQNARRENLLLGGAKKNKELRRKGTDSSLMKVHRDESIVFTGG